MMIIAMSCVCWGVLFSLGYVVFGSEWFRLLALTACILGFVGVTIHLVVVLWVLPLASGARSRPSVGKLTPNEMLD